MKIHSRFDNWQAGFDNPQVDFNNSQAGFDDRHPNLVYPQVDF